MRLQKLSVTAITLLLLGLAPCLANAANVSDLLGLLTGNLGVTEQQAEGGTAAIFNAAKPNLSSDQFSQLTGAIPGLDGLLAKVGGAGGSGSGLGALAGQAGSLLGSSGDSLSSAAQVADSFKQLGLGTDMVGKFSDVILGFVKEQSGPELAQLLQGAML